jgi:ketosteroid isomerase-like protein
MSQENVEVVRRANALFRAGDLEALIDLYHPDAEWRDLLRAPDMPEAVHGRTAISALWKEWLETFDDAIVEINEYIDAHPWVICPTRWGGTGKQSGATIDLRTADAYLVREGKIVRAVVTSYPDVETALKAVGLEE